MKINNKYKKNVCQEKNHINVLMISTKIPYITSGAPVRDYNLLKGLSHAKKNDVSVISFFDNSSKKYIHQVKKNLNIKFFPILKPKEYNLFKKFKEILHQRLPHTEMLKNSNLSLLILNKKIKPDIVQLEELDSFFFINGILNRFDKAKIILDAHNVEYRVLKSGIENMSILKKYPVYLTLQNFKKEEIRALKRVDHIFACSEIDKKYFSNYVSEEKITVIPNGVDSRYFKSENFIKEPIIVFVGLLSYLPNIDALKFYFDDIHPKIKNNIKDVKIYIVGKDPPKWLKKLSKQDKNIIITGFVEDVRGYIKNARVCICPLRYGSGTRLKILEYMSMGKPVVSTSKGAEGLKVVNNKEIMIANNSSKFAYKIIKLLKDDYLSKNIGENARRLIKQKYDWKIINRKVSRVYEKLMREKDKRKLKF